MTPERKLRAPRRSETKRRGEVLRLTIEAGAADFIADMAVKLYSEAGNDGPAAALAFMVRVVTPIRIDAFAAHARLVALGNVVRDRIRIPPDTGTDYAIELQALEDWLHASERKASQTQASMEAHNG